MTVVNESDYVKIERALKFFLWFSGGILSIWYLTLPLIDLFIFLYDGAVTLMEKIVDTLINVISKK